MEASLTPAELERVHELVYQQVKREGFARSTFTGKEMLDALDWGKVATLLEIRSTHELNLLHSYIGNTVGSPIVAALRRTVRNRQLRLQLGDFTESAVQCAPYAMGREAEFLCALIEKAKRNAPPEGPRLVHTPRVREKAAAAVASFNQSRFDILERGHKIMPGAGDAEILAALAVEVLIEESKEDAPQINNMYVLYVPTFEGLKNAMEFCAYVREYLPRTKWVCGQVSIVSGADRLELHDMRWAMTARQYNDAFVKVHVSRSK